MALANVWYLRRVAEASSKPCDICYKPTAGVLITPDNKDHFYICLGHLTDRGFATPVVDEADVASKKKQEELDREIELVKKEYGEKLSRKKKTKDEKKQGAAKKDDKSEEKEGQDKDDDAKAEKGKDEKIKALTSRQSTSSADDEPRVFALQKIFFQKRLDRIRNAEIAKRNRERLKSPNFFPPVPNGDVG